MRNNFERDIVNARQTGRRTARQARQFAAIAFGEVALGGAYLLVAAAPADVRAKVPPAVLQWIPFAVSFLGIFMLNRAIGGSFTVYILGYAVLVFGLLARIAQPNDQIARIIIAVGAVMLVPFFFAMFDMLGFSHVPVLFIIMVLLWFIVTILGIASVGFGMIGTLAKNSNRRWLRISLLPYPGACRLKRY